MCPLTCNRVAAYRYVSRPVICLVPRCCSVPLSSSFRRDMALWFGAVPGIGRPGLSSYYLLTLEW